MTAPKVFAVMEGRQGSSGSPGGNGDLLRLPQQGSDKAGLPDSQHWAFFLPLTADT